MSHRADVIVIGLGVLGSATALRLAREGLSVIGLERFGPVHDRGASHGETRGVLQAYFMGPSYVPLALRSYDLWEDLSASCGESVITRTGGIFLGTTDSTLIAATRASAAAMKLPHEYLDAGDVRRLFPTIHAPDGTVGLVDPSAGFLRPERVVRALLEGAGSAGATLRFGEAVERWREQPDGVEVRTNRETYSAEQLVCCAGAWMPQVLGPVSPPIQVLRKTQLWFAPSGRDEDFDAVRHPFWAWEADGDIYYGFPVVDPGHGLKVARYTGGEPCRPDAVDRAIRAADVDEAVAFLSPRLPRLPRRFLRGTVCLNDMTPDAAFLVGRLPGHARTYVLGGTSGHAFKFAPALAEAIAEQMSGRQTTVDVAMFDPARFAAASTATSAATASAAAATSPAARAAGDGLLDRFLLTGKKALVTGASRGIGHAIARAFAAAGADLILVSRTRSALESLAREVEQAGRQAVVIPCDVADAAQVDAMVQQAIATWGALDVVVNCAGIVAHAGPFRDLTPDDWDTTMRTNFDAIVRVCRAVGPHMLARGSGAIINMSSVAGLNGVPMLSTYAASKAAIISLSRTLAAEWAPHGVRVNALAPGWIATDLTRSFSASPDLSANLLSAVPSGRWGTVDDVTAAALFLAADASRFVTGQCLVIDGGLTAYSGGPGLLRFLDLGRVAL